MNNGSTPGPLTGSDGARVIYILGAGRSGSTLLGRLLNEVDGVFYPGEVRYFWRRLSEGRPCACGSPLDQCPVWGSVLETVRLDTNEVVSLQKRLLRMRNLPRFLVASRPDSDDARRYADLLESFYGAVLRATGARAIVDSSHWPMDAALLRSMAVDVRFVHLVRDPRAVAYSWDRPKQDLHRFTSRRIGFAWSVYNAASSLVAARHGRDRSTLLRYEDLVSDPRAAVEAISRLADVAFKSSSFITDNRVDMHTNHTFWGNPDRLVTGPVQIRPDDEWASRQSPVDRAIVSAMSFPLMMRYGYPLKIRHRRGHETTSRT